MHFSEPEMSTSVALKWTKLFSVIYSEVFIFFLNKKIWRFYLAVDSIIRFLYIYI